MRLHRSAMLAAIGCAVVVTGCLELSSLHCGELYCPAGMVCAAADDAGSGARCVWSDQLAACEDRPDDQSCSFSAGVGRCWRGVCTLSVCGDGLVMSGEVCDDGNTQACDGCSANCRSRELCGDGIVDCSEQCDHGTDNSDAPNADCRLDCSPRRCGDGVVDDRSGEDCDGDPAAANSCGGYGFYAGELSCSSVCRSDTSRCSGRCGDGIVNGNELCDGAAPEGGDSCFGFGFDVGNLACSASCRPDLAHCERLGFTSFDSSAPAQQLRSMWGSGPDDLYIVGGTSVIRHYDGRSWSTVDIGFDEEALWGVWGSGPRDVYVVGGGPTILHFDGDDWTKAPGLDPDFYPIAVWGSGPRDVFAVGYPAAVMHFDGERWTRMPTPYPADTFSSFFATWGSAPNDVYAVGQDGIAMHYDGVAWSRVELPAQVAAAYPVWWGVWGSDARNVFMVGAYGIVIYYDGESWREVSPGVDDFLFGVWGSSPNDVYVIGADIVLRYDGTSWSRVPVNASGDLATLWGASESDVYLAGTSTVVKLGQGSPLFHSYDVPTSAELRAVWAASEADVTAVGRDGTIVHFDGANWTLPASPVTDDLHAVWGSDAHDVYAVGTSGVILHFDGDSWSEQPRLGAATLASVWGSSASDVYAVGDVGTILHNDATGWRVVESGTRIDLRTVWGFASHDVYAAGSGGDVLHFDGTRWSPWPSGLPDTSTISTLWGTRPDRLFALAGTRGSMFDGSTWDTLSLPRRVLTRAAGRSAEDVFAVGAAASGLYHYNGLDWSPIRLDSSIPALTNVWMGQWGGYLTGLAGTVVRLDRACGDAEHACKDRWDNDCDGLLNCADPDCEDDASCAAGGICETTITLACGDSFSGSTAGATPLLEIYPCAERVASGREMFHRFVAPSREAVTVTARLSDVSVALTLVALGAASSGGCNPSDACLASSNVTDGSAEVTFEASPGAVYFVVVDGLAGASGSYKLELQCR